MKYNFEEKTGIIENPYIGIPSFNRFDGDELYSDCIAGHSGEATCETENYECYPVPDGVAQAGSAQGYFPKTTVAYIRILWKNFEPEQGVYNYAHVQDILDKAKAKGQTLMLRLMPHSTCARDDVPDWLRSLMKCPDRPDGMRVKDSPKDKRYLPLFAKAVEQLGLHFDGDPTLDCIDVSLGGAWGEGHQSFSRRQTRALMDVYVRSFPTTKLIGQLKNAKMLRYIGKRRAIGWRADGVGSPKHMQVLYPKYLKGIKKEYWKTAPISFESYWWMSEWDRQGWDLDLILQTMLSLHVSTFNTKSFPIPKHWQEKVENFLQKIGYRFHLKSVEMPDRWVAGTRLSVILHIENKGVAPIYNPLPLAFCLQGDGVAEEITTDVDVTAWLPGEHEVCVQLDVPKTVVSGAYTLAMRIGGGEDPAVRLASALAFDGVWHTLARVEIQEQENETL